MHQHSEPSCSTKVISVLDGAAQVRGATAPRRAHKHTARPERNALHWRRAALPVLALGALISLGVWQLNRLAETTRNRERIAALSSAPAVPLAAEICHV